MAYSLNTLNTQHKAALTKLGSVDGIDEMQEKGLEEKGLEEKYSASDESDDDDEVSCVAVCCSVLQCVALWCSVVQCGAVWCSVVQCDAVWGALCCNMVKHAVAVKNTTLRMSRMTRMRFRVFCSVLQYVVAVSCCSEEYNASDESDDEDEVSVFCSVLQCVAACCSELLQ